MADPVDTGDPHLMPHFVRLARRAPYRHFRRAVRNRYNTTDPERNEKGIDVADQDGNTALHHAMHMNRTLCALALLNAGANPAAVNHAKETPLELAMRQKNRLLTRVAFRRTGRVAARQPVYKRTIEHAKGGIDAKRLEFGTEALRIAAMRGNTRHVKALLNAGVDPNDAGGANGANALHLAAMRGNSDLVETLIKAGSDTEAKDARGRTAADYAQVANHVPLARELFRMEDVARAKAEAPEPMAPAPGAF